MNDLDKKIDDFYRSHGQTLNILPSKLLELAKKGDADAMYDYANTLGSLPSNILTNEESNESFFWMKKASEAGSEEALGHIAMLYITGESQWIVKDEEKGKKILKDLENSRSPVVRNFINLFDSEYFDLATAEEKDDYLFKKINNTAEEIISEHTSYLIKLIPKAVELSEEFISKKEIHKEDRELFAQYLNEHVLTNVFDFENIVLIKELLDNNTYARKEVLDQWENMRKTMHPRDDYMSLKGLSLEKIKNAVIRPEKL